MRSRASGSGSRSGTPLGLKMRPTDLDLSRSLPPLLSALERGGGWDEAFIRFWVSLTGAPRPEWPPKDGRINWIWLTDLERIDRVIDLGSAFGDVAADFAGESAHVSYVGAPSLHGTIVEHRFRGEDAWIDVDLRTTSPGATLDGADCVVFVASEGWQERLPQWIGGASGVVRHAHRMLRPGGWFAFLGPNPVSESNLRAGVFGVPKALRAHRLLRGVLGGLRDAGFSRPRRYVVSPTHELPVVLVPDHPRALQAWGAQNVSDSGWRGRLPLALRTVSFEGALVLAQR